jgi:HK97 family phage portal protein
MSIFSRSRPEQRQFLPERMITPFRSSSSGGTMGGPSVDHALQVSAVWACVRLLADSVSMMPLKAYTFAPDGSRRPIDDPPLVRNPAGGWGMPDWVYSLMVSLTLRGNAYGHIVRRDSLGFAMQVEWWSPDDVQFRIDNAGNQSFTVHGKPVDPADIFHVRAYPMPGSVLGLSPISYAASQISTDRYIQDFAQGFFRDGAHPSSILTTDQDMDQEQSLTAKQRFQAAIKGREPALLAGGLKYQAIQVSPEESQFLATQKYGVASICRVFGVPPEMIAAEAGNSMTYANVEQRSIDYLTYSVQPWLTRLETAIGTLLPGRQHVKFDTSVLLRTDLLTRMKATAIGIASHQLLPDEGRALGDMPPFTDEEKAQAGLIPMTVTPSGLPKALPGSPPAGEPAEPAAPAATPTTPTSGPVK